MRKFLLAALCAVGLVAALPAGALANPTVIFEERCVRGTDGTVVSYGVTIAVAGLPANSEVTGSLDFPGGGSVGPVTLRADASGTLSVGSFGTSIPGVFTLSITSPFTFERSLNVTCQPRPTSAEQCKDGGWRRFEIFKNQGDCVSFVATGGRNGPAAASA